MLFTRLRLDKFGAIVSFTSTQNAKKTYKKHAEQACYLPIGNKKDVQIMNA